MPESQLFVTCHLLHLLGEFDSTTCPATPLVATTTSVLGMDIVSMNIAVVFLCMEVITAKSNWLTRVQNCTTFSGSTAMFMQCFFFGVAVISVMQFALTVKDKGWKNMTKVTITLYCLLFLVGIVRAFFLLFDPYDYRGMVGPVGFRLLFGFPIACLLGLYILIILLWINTYNALNYQKALDRVFRHAWVVITILFIVEFTYDLLNGFYGAGTVDFITLAVYIAFVGLGTLTLAILLTYTRKLYRRLKSVKTNVQNLKKNMKKINSFARGMTIMTIILVVGLGFFTALQIISNQNIFVIMVSQTFQRAMELCYCLLIIIAYWRTFKRVVSTEESTKEDSNKQSSKNSSISKNEKQQKAVMV